MVTQWISRRESIYSKPWTWWRHFHIRLLRTSPHRGSAFYLHTRWWVFGVIVHEKELRQP